MYEYDENIYLCILFEKFYDCNNDNFTDVFLKVKCVRIIVEFIFPLYMKIWERSFEVTRFFQKFCICKFNVFFFF